MGSAKCKILGIAETEKIKNDTGNNPKVIVKNFQWDYINNLNIENQILTSKFFNTSNVFRFRHSVSDDNSKKLRNASKKNIRFSC